MSLLEQQSFIKGIHPFDKLETYELEEISSDLDIVYFKEGETIISPETKPEYLYFIIKGVVQEIHQNEVLAVFAHDEFFDPVSLIENFSKHSFITTQETICYTLKRELFLKVMYQNDFLESFFFQSISQKLNSNISNEQNKELVNFMVARVKDAYFQKPVVIDENTSIYDAVKIMKEDKVSSLIVLRKDSSCGIATDTDFREKVILNRINFDDPVSKIATFGLKTVSSEEFLFNAQLKMNKYGIKRLIVEDEGKIIGVLDLMALTSFFASHTYAVTLQIENSTNIEELKSASKNFIRVVKALYAKGVKVRYISRLLSQLNGKLFTKLFDLSAPEGLKEKSALIIMGSEGRSEQILRTDQDNALIIADNCDIDKKELEDFTKEFSENLCDLGYPLCRGNIMASNPYWRRNLSDFKRLLYNWVNNKNRDDLMNLAIFFDSVTVCGDNELLKELKEYLYIICEHMPSFYSHFAAPVLSFETPLGFFADFIVGKKEHKDELDLKKGGIFPIVHGARSLSLEHGIKESNTVTRLKELNELGIIDKEFTSELIESFNFLLTLRLKARLEKMEAGIELDNYVNPSKLNRLEKDLLKESFKIVDKFKKFLTYHYKLNIIG